MRGLHGTQDRYGRDVLESGLCRSSAAFFCLPDVVREQLLSLTLSCAVYHALGLSVIRSAIRERMPLSQALARQGVEQLIFLVFDVPAGSSWAEALYVSSEGTTYPYVKVSSSGPIATGQAAALTLPAAWFQQTIHTDAASLPPRFFQKPGGKPQYVENCDMAVLKALCTGAAHILSTRYLTLFPGG